MHQAPVSHFLSPVFVRIFAAAFSAPFPAPSPRGASPCEGGGHELRALLTSRALSGIARLCWLPRSVWREGLAVSRTPCSGCAGDDCRPGSRQESSAGPAPEWVADGRNAIMPAVSRTRVRALPGIIAGDLRRQKSSVGVESMWVADGRRTSTRARASGCSCLLFGREGPAVSRTPGSGRAGDDCRQASRQESPAGPGPEWVADGRA